MTRSGQSARSAAESASKADELRTAVYQVLAADRRLRGREQSRPGQLTFAQLRTVAALGREREMTAGQLAKSAELTPATVTSILDQLEAAGIVERRRSTEDRRVYHVTLTPEGWELFERKQAAWQSLWADHLASFSEQEIDTAVSVLQEVTGLLNTLANSFEAARETS